MSDYHIGGWRQDLENYDAIAALPGEDDVVALFGSYKEVAFDPRDVIRIENQGSVGACQGHGLSSVVEWCHCIASGDTGLQLSRAMGYYETQRIDKLDRRGDVGSTIDGGVQLAMTVGICREELWPYSGRYDNRRPGNFELIKADAEQYRIGSKRRMQTYDGIRTFLGSGQGGISIGIPWDGSMDRPVLEQFRVGRGGGHAIALLSLSERKDSRGRPYVWMLNSWGQRWGNNGWAEWSPTAIEQMLRHQWTVAVGLSDMPNVEPRELSISQIADMLRS